MYIVKRQSAQGGFNIKRRGGAIHRLYNMKMEGLGKAKSVEFNENNNASHPFKSLSGGNLRSFENVRLKGTKPKKYISLNI